MFSSTGLRRIRKKKGLTQEEVARRCGLATATISKLEEGKSTDPKMSTVLKLAMALECSLDAFFSQRPADGSNGDLT
jgi:transcriptional regulator with XRE-family HTH domain